MKLVVFVFLTLASCQGGLYDVQIFLSEQDVSQIIVKLAAEMIWDHIMTSTMQARDFIFDPLDDPTYIEDLAMELPLDSSFSQFMYGNLSVCGNAVAFGTSTIIEDGLTFTMDPNPRGTYIFQAGEVNVSGKHDLDMTLLQSLLHLISTGHFNVTLTNGTIDLEISIEVLPNDEVNITAASLELSFDSLVIFTTSAWATFPDEDNEEVEVNWESVNEDIKEVFVEAWEALKPEVDDYIKYTAQEALKECLFTHLVEGDYSCVTGGSSLRLMSMEDHLFLESEFGNTCLALVTTPPSDNTTPEEDGENTTESPINTVEPPETTTNNDMPSSVASVPTTDESTPSTATTTPSTAATTPSTVSTTPSTAATTPSTAATTPSTAATTPSTAATTPSTVSTTPSAATTPSTATTTPSTAATTPSTASTTPSTAATTPSTSATTPSTTTSTPATAATTPPTSATTPSTAGTTSSTTVTTSSTAGTSPSTTESATSKFVASYISIVVCTIPLYVYSHF